MMTEQEKQELIGQVVEAWIQQDKAGKVRRFQELNKIGRKGQIVFAGSSLINQDAAPDPNTREVNL